MNQRLSLCKESQRERECKATKPDKENVEKVEFLANLVPKSGDHSAQFSGESWWNNQCFDW